MAYNKAEKSDSPMKRRGGRRRKKVCVFCGKENNEIDYKDVNKLKRYVSERGKILPRRITGNCESSDCCYQESTSHCTDALRSGLIHLCMSSAPSKDGALSFYTGGVCYDPCHPQNHQIPG